MCKERVTNLVHQDQWSRAFITDLLAVTFRGGGPPAPVEIGDRLGYMDDKGEVVDPRFEQAAPFADGLAAVKQNGRWSFIRPDGRTAFTADTDFVRGFHDGLTLIRDGNGKYNYLTNNGEKLTQAGFKAAQTFPTALPKPTSATSILMRTTFRIAAAESLLVSALPLSAQSNPILCPFTTDIH